MSDYSIRLALAFYQKESEIQHVLSFVRFAIEGKHYVFDYSTGVISTDTPDPVPVLSGDAFTFITAHNLITTRTWQRIRAFADERNLMISGNDDGLSLSDGVHLVEVPALIH